MPEKKKRAEAALEKKGVVPDKGHTEMFGLAIGLPPAVEAPKAQEPPVAAMTAETFATEVNRLIDRATAAGLRPLPVMASILAKRGMGLLDQTRAVVADGVDRFLASLEGAHAKEEKK